MYEKLLVCFLDAREMWMCSLGNAIDGVRGAP